MLALLFVAFNSLTLAEETVVTESQAEKISTDEVKAAIQKAIPHLENGAKVSAEERTCFTCHNQGLPILALTQAQSLGFKVDQSILDHQIEHTWKHLNRGKSRYENGRGQGGQIMTAGYAMWSLAKGDHQPDEVTTAVVHYLLEDQTRKKKWASTDKRRPPSSGSHFTATFLAASAVKHYGTDEQAEKVKPALELARTWIQETEASDTEDHAFRLRGLKLLGCDEATVQKEVTRILDLQHRNGGWSQTEKTQPDAYATATVLAALRSTSNSDEVKRSIERGLRYLLETQLDDGTWHVTTRADGFQDYYESGFPHDEDQFISIAATGWAVLALSDMLK